MNDTHRFKPQNGVSVRQLKKSNIIHQIKENYHELFKI